MKEIDKGQKSFYKPYIDLILSNNFNSYPVFWNEDDKIELNDGDFEDKISNYNDEINQTCDLMKKKTDVNKFEHVLFKKIYTFVISKQIVINENRSLLVPLVDLLNDKPTIDVKYTYELSEDTVLFGSEELIEAMAELGGFKVHKVLDDDRYVMGYTFEVVE
jgi:hypothetical protein